MVVFRDFEDVEEWLKPLDYIAFWEAIAPYTVLSLDVREHCDGLIVSGTVESDLILKTLKGSVANEIARRFDLPFRVVAACAETQSNALH